MDAVWFAVMLCVFAAVILIGAGLSIIGHYRKLKKQPDESESTPAKPEYTQIKALATVEELACWVETVGYKTPKTSRIFSVVFRLESGEEWKLNIPEEMYHGLEKGQTGMLTVVDGELYGFELE